MTSPVVMGRSFSGSRTAQALVQFANEHAGARGYLKGPAAQAGRIPSLTPEAKERAKQRWQSAFTEQHTVRSGTKRKPPGPACRRRAPPVAAIHSPH